MEIYNIKVTSVDYSVTEQDIDSSYDLDSKTQEEIDDIIQGIKNSLPQTMMLSVECEKEDLEDQIANLISEKTGWLINSFTYEQKAFDDFWLKSSKTGYYYHMQEGTGDALTQEDIDAGYVDYIYYDYYECINDIYEDSAYDGGCILLKTLYRDMTTSEVIKKLADFENEKEEDLVIVK